MGPSRAVAPEGVGVGRPASRLLRDGWGEAQPRSGSGGGGGGGLEGKVLESEEIAIPVNLRGSSDRSSAPPPAFFVPVGVEVRLCRGSVVARHGCP